MSRRPEMTLSASHSFAGGTRYRLDGSGPLLVLVHGVGMDLEMWEPVAARLAPHRRVLRYDMLGHGESEKPAGPYRLADFVDQLHLLASQLGLARFDLAGFSMGAMVAQAFAAAHPDQVARLVLLSPVHERNPSEAQAVVARASGLTPATYRTSIPEAIERWFTPAFRARNPEAVDRVRRRMEANDFPAYTAAYTVFAHGDRELGAVLGLIAAPTLAMTGSEDRRSTPTMSQALAAKLPKGRCLIVEGRRHLLPLEVPEIVAAAIDEFLSGAVGAPERMA